MEVPHLKVFLFCCVGDDCSGRRAPTKQWCREPPLSQLYAAALSATTASQVWHLFAFFLIACRVRSQLYNSALKGGFEESEKSMHLSLLPQPYRRTWVVGFFLILGWVLRVWVFLVVWLFFSLSSAFKIFLFSIRKLFLIGTEQADIGLLVYDSIVSLKIHLYSITRGNNFWLIEDFVHFKDGKLHKGPSKVHHCFCHPSTQQRHFRSPAKFWVPSCCLCQWLDGR